MATEVQKDLYGVGFSPLSIKNKKYAEPEELLADKEAGLLAIYQADGSVISAEYLSRIKRHLKEFTQRCIDDSTVGYIYRVNVTDALVKSIKKTENLFVNTLEFDNGKNPYQFIRLSMDADLFNKHEYIPLDLNNVKASVVRNQKAPLLLGQSVLGKLGKIEIDNEKRLLKVTTRKKK